MSRWLNVAGTAATLTLSVSLTSCNSSPSRVGQPSINASGAASKAIEAFDKNADGNVSGDELDRAPILKSSLARLDTNSDKSVSADEISERINAWKQMRTGLTSFSFTMTMDGAPLTDATVTFEPESFLGESVKPAVAVTNASGRGRASIQPEPGQSPMSVPPGMHIGMYRVKVSKQVNGKELIPAKYNEQTVLAQEVAPDVAEIGANRVVYALTSR